MKKATYLLLALLVLLALPVTAMAAETVDSVCSQIEDLPTVEEFKAMDEDQQLDAYNRTQAAYDAYMALSEEEKERIEGAEEIFESLFSHYNTLIAPAEAESANEGNNVLTWVILAVLAAIVIIPGFKKKNT